MFDGHGGDEAAVLAEQRVEAVLKGTAQVGSVETVLRETFIQLDSEIEETDFLYGCTAAIVLVDGRNVYSANAGDARTILINNKDGAVTRLSHDHSVNDVKEVERIEAVGGQVRYGRIVSDKGAINVARALGDKNFGESVSPEPYISKTELTEGDYTILTGCDGLFAVMDDEEVATMMKGQEINKNSTTSLIDHALSLGTNDNVTVSALRVKVE